MDKLQELKKIKELLDDGIITKEEFKDLKDEILGTKKPSLPLIDDIIEEKESNDNKEELVEKIEHIGDDIIGTNQASELHNDNVLGEKEPSGIKEDLIEKTEPIGTEFKETNQNQEDDVSKEASSREVNEKSKKKGFKIPKIVYIIPVLIIPLLWWVFTMSEDKEQKNKLETIDSTSIELDSNTNDKSVKKFEFKTYVNDSRFYKIDYPTNLTIGRPSANDDGRSFTNKAGEVEITVYSSILHENTLLDEYNQILKNYDNVTYNTFKGDWYVISGYTDNSKNIFYLKGYLSDEYNEVRTLVVSYSKAKQKDYDSNLPRILSSFKDIPIDSIGKKDIKNETKGEPALISGIKRNPNSEGLDFDNVFWYRKYTLFDLSTDEPIFPVLINGNFIYKIYYSSNEDPNPYYGEFSIDELESLHYYKFKNKENCLKFCKSKK